MTEEFDLGIIGAGPAGYTAALNAVSDGKKVVLFEKEFAGGVCLNRGCIPTKTLLHSAELFEEFKCCENVGICVENCRIDFAKIMERKQEVIEKLRTGLERALKNARVTLINEEAEIVDKNTIKSLQGEYLCKRIICAVGSSPREIKGLEFDGRTIISSDDVLNFDKLPESIAIIGSGAIGIEFSRIFSAFGSRVILIEMAENLLPNADIEVSKRVERIFKSKNIEFYTKTTVKNIEKTSEYAEITLSNDEKLKVEKVLVAVGRVPNSVKRIEGVEYIGDVAGSVQLAHFAGKQALEFVAGIPFNKNLVPAVIYGNPEIAWIGKREQDLEKGFYQKSMILISSLGKSLCDDCMDGMIKILAKDNKILGAHIISKEASSLIQQIAIAMQADLTIDELKSVCFAHPTYSEGIFDCLMRLK